MKSMFCESPPPRPGSAVERDCRQSRFVDLTAQAMTGVDASCCTAGLIINREVGWIDTTRRPAIRISRGIGTEIVVRDLHVVLGCGHWIPVHQEPGLVRVLPILVGTKLFVS